MKELNFSHSFLHKIQYYETDKMGIVHHSNYIRFFEEARTDYFEKTGFGYDVIEKQGLMVPVLGITCDYKLPSEYGQTLEIHLKTTHFDGIKFSFEYAVTSQQGQTLHATGISRHCFLTDKFKPTLIKKTHPHIYEYMINLLENSK